MNAKIVSNFIWGAGLASITLEAPEVASAYKAGQLLMLSVNSGSTDPLLKRPFAPYSIDKSNGYINILYAVVGKGTRVLSTKQAGYELDISMPHGKPFTFSGISGVSAALVAGGLGCSPMRYLAEVLAEKNCDITFYYGAKNMAYIYPPLQEMSAYKKIICTDDGSFGLKGFVTDIFSNDVKNKPFSMVYSCGPKIMMSKAASICKENNIPVEVSMEEKMGCGLGLCNGCMINTIEKDKISMKRCCTEGPVFDGRKIVWH